MLPMGAATDPSSAALQFAAMTGMQVGGDQLLYEDDLTDNTIPDIQKITKKNNILPLWGNVVNMNLNALVLENIVQCTYYKNYLAEANTFQTLVDEVYYNVKHLEPWERGTRKTQGMTGMCGGVRGVGAGGVVSTAFCILYKMFTIRITRRQLVSMINSTQSGYLRGLGFMYIRFCQPPSDLWAWMEPYLDDDEEVDPRSGGGDKMTVGQMVKAMLTKLDWYGTLFPRIPVPIMKDIDSKLSERNASDSRERTRDVNRDRERDRDWDRRWGDERKEREREKDKEKERRDAKIHKHRCAHHLRHHHCRKHRKKCPQKGKKAKEAEKPMEVDSKPTEK